MRRLVLVFLLACCAPAFAEPVMTEREVQREPAGRSGFWTNPYPAKGGAYRWRMLAIGGGLLVITGYGMWRLVKKASTERHRSARLPDTDRHATR